MSGVFGHDFVYRRLFALAMLALIFSPLYTSAQDNYEIQMYGYDLIPPGTRWSNVIATSRVPPVSRYRRS